MNPILTKPDAKICVHCHALIDGDASALQRTGTLIEFSDCGRHIQGRWDRRPAKPAEKGEEQ